MGTSCRTWQTDVTAGACMGASFIIPWMQFSLTAFAVLINLSCRKTIKKYFCIMWKKKYDPERDLWKKLPISLHSFTERLYRCTESDLASDILLVLFTVCSIKPLIRGLWCPLDKVWLSVKLLGVTSAVQTYMSASLIIEKVQSQQIVCTEKMNWHEWF